MNATVSPAPASTFDSSFSAAPPTTSGSYAISTVHPQAPPRSLPSTLPPATAVASIPTTVTTQTTTTTPTITRAVLPSQVKSTSSSDPFWVDDPTILVAKGRLVEFFPTADMTVSEKMNSVSRLVIYVSVILAVYQNQSMPIHFGILLLGILWFLWKNQTVVDREPLQKLEHFADSEEDLIEQFEPGTVPTPRVARPQEPRIPVERAIAKTMPVIKQSATVELPDLTKTDAACVMPTAQNPFMNHLMYDDPKRGRACQGPGIQEQAANLLDKQLFDDVNDLYSRNANQRLFRTMPNTTRIPDTQNFANWLVKGEPNCKEDGQCYPWEDIRQQRQLIPEDLDKQFNVTGFNM